MIKYVSKRLLMLVPVFLGVSIISFTIMQITPGDPILVIIGNNPTSDPETLARLRHEWGLDQPIHIQYLRYMWRLGHGDMGYSYVQRRPVNSIIFEAIPRTIYLTIFAMLVGIGIGVPAGIIAATKQYSLTDKASTLGALIGVSTPNFWLALILIWAFAFRLRIFPISGYGGLNFVILPAFAMGTSNAGIISRLTRSSMLEVARQDYVRTAVAKGLNERRVITNHMLRNALVPVVTVLGLQFGFLLGGAFIIETIFAWPGLGRVTVGAINARDYPVVQGSVLISAIIFVFVNLLVDILYAYIDPRIQYN